VLHKPRAAVLHKPRAAVLHKPRRLCYISHHSFPRRPSALHCRHAEYIQVVTTTEHREDAESIARALVEAAWRPACR